MDRKLWIIKESSNATTLKQTTPADLGFCRVVASIAESAGILQRATTMQEQWREFANGNYEVSSHGRIRRKTPGRNTHPGRIMTPTLLTIGYHQVGPTIDGKNIRMYVHRIVAEAFLGECHDHHEVNHIDGDKTNNRVDNLEYVTHCDNMRHARVNNMIRDRLSIDWNTVVRIRTLRKRGMSYGNIAKETGVSLSHCWHIANYKTRKEL